MFQVVGFLPSTWEICTGFLAPSFGHYGHLGTQWMGILSFYISVSLSFAASQNKPKKKKKTLLNSRGLILFPFYSKKNSEASRG